MSRVPVFAGVAVVGIVATVIILRRLTKDRVNPYLPRGTIWGEIGIPRDVSDGDFSGFGF